MPPSSAAGTLQYGEGRTPTMQAASTPLKATTVGESRVRRPTCRSSSTTPVPTEAATNMSPTSVAAEAPTRLKKSCQDSRTARGIYDLIEMYIAIENPAQLRVRQIRGPPARSARIADAATGRQPDRIGRPPRKRIDAVFPSTRAVRD